MTASKKPLQRKEKAGTERPGLAARGVATVLLSAVLDERRSLDGLLDPTDGLSAYRALPDRDRRLVHAIVGIALRRHGEIVAALDRLIERRPPRKAGSLIRVIEVAATQILFMGVADHAAVSVALDQLDADPAARHYKGFANAVLRRLARERDSILVKSAARVNTPDWLWSRWVANYGETSAGEIAAAHLVEPSLDLTVKGDPKIWAERLGGIVLSTGSVRLVPAGPIEDLPGFAEGAWWVQDAAAALPARLLGDVAALRVVDLCAAPGGKTAQLAQAGAEVTAVDISATRLERLTANLARLGLSAETVAADVLTWTPSEPFDAVLLDAPCTSTGTIRRHPDIPWLKRPDDIPALAELQAKMIDRAIAMLKPGGTLIYCTCSLEPGEGEAQLARSLDRHPLSLIPVVGGEVGGLVEAVTSAGTVRTLPNQLRLETPRLSGLDGFFIARLRKH